MRVALTFYLLIAFAVSASRAQQPRIAIKLRPGSETKRFQAPCRLIQLDSQIFDTEIDPQCNASFFQTDFFREMKHDVTELEIENINLSSTINSSLQSLTQLKSLALVNNALTVMPETFFQGFPNLTKLSLARNGFVETAFLRFADLEALALLDNKASRQDIKHLGRLKELHLNRYDVEFLTNSDTFETMKDLERLKLTPENGPENTFSLPADIFKENKKLNTLILTMNGIKDAHYDTFAQLDQLNTLDLSGNSLNSANMAGWFRNLANLQTLDLRNNALGSVERDTFLGLRNLNTLYLSANIFENFQPSERMPFHHLEKLKTIDMSSCSLEHFTAEWFFNLARLESIDLSCNLIEEVSYNDFLRLSSGRGSVNLTVNLEGNEIRRIDCLPRNSTQNNHTTVLDIKFDRTVFEENKCDKEFLSAYADSKIKLHFEAPSNPTDTRKANCKCDRNFDPCTCEFHPETRKLALNCANKLNSNLSALEDMIQMLHSYVSYTIDLDLSGNRIGKDLKKVVEWLNHVHVRALNLARNEITGNVSIAAMTEKLPRLRLLDLRNNSIERVDLSLFEPEQALSIYLEGNLLSCECHESFWLTSLLSRRNVSEKIVDFDELLCYFTSRENQTKYFLRLNNFTVSEYKSHCQMDQFKIVAIVSVTAPFLTAMLLAGLLFQRRLRKIKEKIGDSRSGNNNEHCAMLYDAFISYSHKDEEFVIKEIVSALENPGNGSPSYRLCLHERDWVAGEWIEDQIRQSIASSRRTIILLSENFVESYWATVEFRVAYEQIIHNRRKRLVVIIEDKVPNLANVDRKLKHYVTNNTYLRCKDPDFHDRLRKALGPKTGSLIKGDFV